MAVFVAGNATYKSPCRSVRPSVGPSVGPSVRRSVTPSLRRLLGASYAEYSALFSYTPLHWSVVLLVCQSATHSPFQRFSHHCQLTNSTRLILPASFRVFFFLLSFSILIVSDNSHHSIFHFPFFPPQIIILHIDLSDFPRIRNSQKSNLCFFHSSPQWKREDVVAPTFLMVHPL